MKCEACHKHEASVAYTHIVENQKQTLHLCRDCNAAQQGNAAPLPPPTAAPAAVQTGDSSRRDEPAVTRCDHCGMTYDDFRKGGRFGCPGCYEAFDHQLERLMKRIHGATRHQGKGLPQPRLTVPATEELAQLRQDLESAVAAEAYERAATVRDRIRAIERGQVRLARP